MRLLGLEIDTSKMPKQAWIIIAIGILIVCLGVAGSFILRGSITINHAPAAQRALQMYEDDPGLTVTYEDDEVLAPPMEEAR